MNKFTRYPASMSRQSLGQFQVDVRESAAFKPIENATVAVKKTAVDAQTIETLTTDDSGQTITIELETPSKELSLDIENEEKPYSEYTIEVTKEGYEPTVIEGSQLLADTKAVQAAQLRSTETTAAQSLMRRRRRYRQESVYFIEPHTLYEEYPPKIPEDSVKELPEGPAGFIVLDTVVVPEYMVVHDGDPFDPGAPNYFVSFQDYIINVASSEIYATWPEATITANILAILSFTLNRVYTEWYRNKGFDFMITSSTAYDHKYIHNRNSFQNISQIVNTIFTNYITKPGIKQPLLTQYCDGKQVQCPGWMTIW
ncbi:carboxypeptidase-like regulatory domain-containing protein [Vallitalea okinawensis]|uniref:carboxypeptidase-like regulatory domain-containing protein n=1 Tax=Vallitalea okinawensis TaxID=2078660 RepID=UPI001FA87F22|nr:carboxypeptidase-like regulatory domain-containing protein [Vallitalea okinawensis]